MTRYPSSAAGVPARLLRRLVLKELTDNSLDAGGEVEVGGLEDGGYYVQDDGPGIGRATDCGSKMARSLTTSDSFIAQGP